VFEGWIIACEPPHLEGKRELGEQRGTEKNSDREHIMRRSPFMLMLFLPIRTAMHKGRTIAGNSHRPG